MKKFDDMYFFERLTFLSSGNKEALKFLMSNFEDENFNIALEVLFNYDIKGNNINVLFNKACFKSKLAYDITIKMLYQGVYSISDVSKNLSRSEVVPFVSLSTLVYADYLDDDVDYFNNFCFLNKSIYDSNVGFVKVK